tara:strand:- start:96 stop:512 length:417 start_codon:yes stop_codon:yes gene_type:complete
VKRCEKQEAVDTLNHNEVDRLFKQAVKSSEELLKHLTQIDKRLGEENFYEKINKVLPNITKMNNLNKLVYLTILNNRKYIDVTKSKSPNPNMDNIRSDVIPQVLFNVAIQKPQTEPEAKVVNKEDVPEESRTEIPTEK